MEKLQSGLRSCLLGAAAAALVAAAPGAAPDALVPPAHAGLQATNPVTNARALLRYALPINNQPIREIQKALEKISDDLRVPGSKSLGSVAKRVRTASSVLDRQIKAITGDFAPGSRAAGEAAIDKLKKGLSEFQALIDAEDKQEVPIKQQEVLTYVGDIEAAMVKGFPFDVPAAYADLPQLKGRATVEMKLRFSDPRMDGITGGTFTIVADGYNAPVSAGDFVDLVSRGFYNGMEIQRADGFVVQTGKPDGDVSSWFCCLIVWVEQCTEVCCQWSVEQCTGVHWSAAREGTCRSSADFSCTVRGVVRHRPRGLLRTARCVASPLR